MNSQNSSKTMQMFRLLWLAVGPGFWGSEAPSFILSRNGTLLRVEGALLIIIPEEQIYTQLVLSKPGHVLTSSPSSRVPRASVTGTPPPSPGSCGLERAGGVSAPLRAAQRWEMPAQVSTSPVFTSTEETDPSELALCFPNGTRVCGIRGGL